MYYTPYALKSVAADDDRRHLQKDAHFVGMCLIAITAAMYGLSYLISFVLYMLQVNLTTFQTELVNMGFYALTTAPPAIFAAVVCHRPIRPLSDHRPVRPVTFVCLVSIGLSICIFANLVANYIVSFLSNFGIGTPDFSNTVDGSTQSVLINLLSTAILPGVCEELVFRGYILQALRRYGDGFAITASAVLFGLLHRNVLQIPFALIMGLICGYVVVQTRNIWIAITIHTLNNAMAVLLTALLHAESEAVYIQTNVVVSLALAVLGAVCFVALKAADSPVLQRPSSGWTNLTKPQKWGGLFTSPAFLIAVILLGLLTLFNTIAYSIG